MKKASRRIFELCLKAIAAVALMMVVSASLQARVVYTDPYDGYSEETFMDMDLEPNIATPVVPDDEKATVAAFVEQLAQKMNNKAYVTELMREGEVMVMTFQSDKLFMPNDTLLTDDADKLLKPLFKLMKTPDLFKVVITVHTDDTGSDYYREQLSTSRLYSIYEYLLTEADDGKFDADIIIIPFALGSNDPVEDNDTRRGRAANRRVEFYFVPGPGIIKAAHEGTLHNIHI